MAMMCGFFEVMSLSEPDAQGNDSKAVCKSEMVGEIEFSLYLPPYLRENVCEMATGKKVFAFADTVTGIGCAVMGVDCDCTYYQKSPYHFNDTVEIDKSVTAHDTLDVTKDITSSTGNITASIGDVKATTVSLKLHVHPFTGVANVEGTAGAPPAALPVVAAGTATGTTNPPTA